MNGPLDIGGQFGGQEVFVKRLGQLSKYIMSFSKWLYCQTLFDTKNNYIATIFFLALFSF